MSVALNVLVSKIGLSKAQGWVGPLLNGPTRLANAFNSAYVHIT
jgi:hypothetical protein